MLHFVVIMKGVECSCMFHISRALCCYWLYEVFLKLIFSMFFVHETDTNRSPSKCTFSPEGLKYLGVNNVIIIIIIIHILWVK